MKQQGTKTIAMNVLGKGRSNRTTLDKRLRAETMLLHENTEANAKSPEKDFELSENPNRPETQYSPHRGQCQPTSI